MNTQRTQNTEIKEYIHAVLYPALYDVLDKEEVFNEFNFKRIGNKYESTTAHKISGRTGKTKGQVIVYANNPGRLVDHSEESTDFIEYLQRSEGLTFIEAINRIATLAGVKPYKFNLPAEELEELNKERQKAKTWEAVINYCIQCINDVQFKHEAEELVDYLTKDRKYNVEDLRTMQLGYLPSKEKLYSYLEAKGFTEEEIKEIKLLPNAGTSHKLTIPIRNRRGLAIGLAIRNTSKEATKYKYIYNPGLKKGETLFNLYTKAKEGSVILVEGQLDAAITVARGYNYATVAAIGGKEISVQQVEHLIAAGTKNVYIALDNEAETEKEINKTIDLLAKEEQLEDRIYIVQLPEGIKDIDQLVTISGVEALEEAVKKAAAYYLYRSDKRIEAYVKQTEKEGHSDQAVNDLIDDIVQIAAKLNNPIRRDDLKNLFVLNLQTAGIAISAEALNAAVDRIRYKEDKAKQTKELGQLLKDVEAKRIAGKVEEAIEDIQDRIREVKLRDKRTEYEQLEATQRTEEAVKDRILKQPEGVKTGYKVLIEGNEADVILPAGQLTFIAAATGHGKTAFLLNASLNIIEAYPQKEVYLFTFEQSADEILLRALNTFIGIDLNRGGRNSLTLLDYYKGRDFIANDRRQIFNERKELFFNTIAPRLKIINVEYSANEIIDYIEYIRRRTDEVVICIDYIQKLRSDRKGKIEGRYTELKFICEDLQAAALPSRTGLPFLIAAQFKREVSTPLEMHPTMISEASDIEKIASEILGLWNCTKKLGRKVDNNDAKALIEDYGISSKEFNAEQAVILEVLKSRSMSTGHRVKLPYNGNTGKIDADTSKPIKEATPRSIYE